MSWTHALRQIVTNCYEYHGREDLLPKFSEEGDTDAPMGAVVRQNNEASGIDIKPAAVASTSSVHVHHHHQPAEVRAVAAAQPTTSYAAAGNGGAATVVHTNPDGTISLIQVDPANPIITLPDGTTAQVQGLTAAAVEAGGSGEHPQAVQVQHP